MRTNIFFILFYFILFYNCTPSRSSFVGNYFASGNENSFNINKDSTFEYTYNGVGYKYSFGTWKQKEKEVIELNSDVQVNEIPIKISYSHSKDLLRKIHININILDKDARDYICSPVIDQLEFPNYLIRGSYCFYMDRKIKKIYFKLEKRPLFMTYTISRLPMYPIRTEEIEMSKLLKDGMDINIDICFNDSLFSYRIFKRENVKIKNNNLFFYDTEEHKRNKLYLSYPKRNKK